jgi:hypothetical protein
LTCQPHQVQLIVDIVHGQEMGSGSLFCSNMVDVGSSEAKTALCGRTAACTLTALLNRAEVLGKDGIAEIEDAS